MSYGQKVIFAMFIQLVLVLVVGAVIFSTLPIPYSNGGDSTETERARWVAQEALHQRAMVIVNGGVVVKRQDGLCVLYTETSIGAVGRFPLMLQVECPLDQSTVQ